MYIYIYVDKVLERIWGLKTDIWVPEKQPIDGECSRI